MKFAYDIPDSFWSLFRSMNRELYMEALLKINEEYEYNNYYLSKETERLSDKNANRNRFVASHREVLQERLNAEREERRERVKAERDAERARVKEARQNIFDSLEVGQKIHGKVTKIMPYGAFIDIGEGLEGLAHINNLSWKRVESVEDVVAEGQELDVYVLEVNRENYRIALAVKDINNDPWKLIAQEVAVGDVITGKVVRTIERGAFVEIKEGVEAYLPISQLSENRVPTVNSVVNPGDEIEAKILNFQPEEKRMLISIKEVNAEPEEDYTQFMKPEESLGATIGDAVKKSEK